MFSTFFLVLVAMLQAFEHGVSMASKINNRPIVGILTEPTLPPFTKYGEEFIEAMYVDFLELAGARVVPIRGKQPAHYYKQLFKNINGALFPGGAASMSSGPYVRSGRYIYDMAVEANDNGDFFPIWGTCLGFQVLTVLRANHSYLQPTDTENFTLPLRFKKGFSDSRLFRQMPKDLIRFLSTENITQNNHHFSLLLKDYKTVSSLHNFYHLLSTNVGRDKKEFVSTFEAYTYPFYGVQWHPAKSIFLWRTDQAINHDYHSIKVSQYLADFFINETRKSLHHYNSTDEEAHAVIENAVRIFTPDFKANDNGDYFPVWGTCLGFELLTVLTANRNYLGHTHTENVTLPLMFAKGFEKSRLFSKMPKQLVEHLADEAITQNNHYYSLLLKDYRNISVLNDFYRLISTSVGMDKKEFVSTFEAYNYPFYGVQWHPEKSIFLWRTDQAINHDYHSIKVSQYMTNFFVQEARKSFHHYDSTDEEAHAVIENAVRVFIPDFRVDEKFYFNYTNNHFINRYGLGSDLVS